MKLDTNNHSVFEYRLIMVVKYRRKGIGDTISTRLKTIFENIGANYHISVKNEIMIWIMFMFS
ncbi:hypothetical protein BACCIP111899_01276 [Bacillus rhizoplanae]|uniref:Transposase IS200-like domain-containing protein n=1 Tax=Bacillus rhizoplanae TaxID=2880966 RepID=A0ABN7ZT32_9BACI|nr:hypothetical protein BACCIP111899_01276 [Bacillus rhizoplanae]